MTDEAQDILARLPGLIRETRTERGLTLEALAKVSGVSRSMASQIERGESSPTVATLVALARALDLDLGALFSGALVTETVFAWPGMGKLIYDSIMGNDYNLALVALLLATLVTLAGNLLADIAYLWLDPRIRYH